MRNKKSLLSLGLIALVLVLGVGYAIVSNQYLEISGSASAGGNVKVSFLSASNNNNDKVVAETTDGSLTASIEVTNLSTVGEKITATYVLQNEETDVDANVIVDGLPSVMSENGLVDLSQYFSVTTNIDDENGLSVLRGDTATFEVYVELLKTPLTLETSIADITIELVASAVIPNS